MKTALKDIKSEVIITGFYGTSSEKFANFSSDKGFKTLLFGNDKNANAIGIINTVNSFLGMVFSFGQRPNIRNQIHIESNAKLDSKILKTNINIEKLEQAFTLQGLKTKVSHNAELHFVITFFITAYRIFMKIIYLLKWCFCICLLRKMLMIQ